MQFKLLKVRWLVLGVLLLGTSVRAHNSPNSALYFDFKRASVATELILPLADLELSFKQPLTSNPAEILDRYGAALKEYILRHIKLQAEDGRPWNIICAGMEARSWDQPSDLRVQLEMTPPAGASVRKFILNYSVITHALPNHYVMVSVRNDWDTAVFSTKPEPIGTIEFDDPSLKIDRERGGWWQGFRSVFNVGMHHIAEGTDHLLFLLALLLPAPLLVSGKRWGRFAGLGPCLRKLVRIVTAFTAGHSLTLIIGSLGWFELPGRAVEILIAISILISALHALKPLFAGREAFIAGGFGLVHGLAFAGTIAEYGFSAWHLALTVVAFNLGIEAMQLVVVVLIIPWLVILSRTSFYSLIRITGASFAGLASLGWMGDRAFDLTNPMELPVDAIAEHPARLIAFLSIAAALATIWERIKHRSIPIAEREEQMG